MAAIAYSDVAGRSLAYPASLQRCRRLGLGGSLALVIGGAIAGLPPSTDPLLQQPTFRAMRAFVTPAVALVYIGLALLIMAWWRLGKLVRSEDRPTVRQMVVTFAWWGAPLLVTMPIFSKDVYSYIVQGAMAGFGVDPYHYGPQIMPGNLSHDVPQIWQTTPAPYGPVFLALAEDVVRLTGQTTWLGVLGMRVMALVGIALIFFAISRLAPLAGVDPAYGIWLGVMNPVVLVHLVGDAHNDALMIGLMMAGLTLAIERRPAMGSVLVTLAGLIKAPAGLALVFIMLLWAHQLSGRTRYVRAILLAGGLAIATVVATTELAGTGYGWVGALNTPTIAHTWTSITTDLGYVTGLLVEKLGLATMTQATTVWHLIGYAAAGVVIVIQLRRHRTNPALGVGIGLAAVIFFSPVFHPWYMLWATVPLAAAATSDRVRKLVIISLLLMSSLVLPGGINPTFAPIAGGVLGILLVVVTDWAIRNLDRNDLLGSARTALGQLTPAELRRRAREAWRAPTTTEPAAAAETGEALSAR